MLGMKNLKKKAIPGFDVWEYTFKDGDTLLIDAGLAKIGNPKAYVRAAISCRNLRTKGLSPEGLLGAIINIQRRAFEHV